MGSEAFIDVVKVVASELRLVDSTGKLLRLDSLGIMDMVIELEARTGLSVPTVKISPEAFKTIESIAALLAEVKGG